jgi:uncharacterized protein (DUF1697 family)
MPAFIALLRAVNVGGTGKLPMSDLKSLCEAAGLAKARTYIASGNVVFDSPLIEKQVKAALETGLQAYAGRPVGVMVRTAGEMAAIAAANPFPEAPGNRTLVVFLDEAPPKDALDKVSGLNGEAVQLGSREIYIRYTDGMAQSKLKVPAAKAGTGRNMNTVQALAAMAASL